jgi:predicted MFS family arabinose efflux permease
LTSSTQPATRHSSLAPFQVRSFRFQWPADLATSWAFEMETLILGWYVLVETESVMWLTVFASLQYIGTLVAPMFGVIGGRIGNRKMLCNLRIIYTLKAVAMMVLAFSNLLDPLYVFALATIMGVVRPSDLVMRNALIGQTMPSIYLSSAMSASRTTTDSARVAGALAGVGMVATLGMGPAYVAITSFYALSFLLTLGVSNHMPDQDHLQTDSLRTPTAATSPWRELREVCIYVWNTPHLLATMCLAFLINLTAFPITAGLLPHVAKDIYQTGQTGLGYLAASFALGALLGSLTLSRHGNWVMCGRMMIGFGAVWYAMLLVFAQLDTAIIGIPVIMLAGVVQSFALVPMSVLLIRTCDERHRGGVLGLRILAVYGLPLGLVAASPLINHFSFRTMGTLYALFGLVAIALIVMRWHAAVWARESPANQR